MSQAVDSQTQPLASAVRNSWETPVLVADSFASLRDHFAVESLPGSLVLGAVAGFLAPPKAQFVAGSSPESLVLEPVASSKVHLVAGSLPESLVEAVAVVAMAVAG